MKKGQIDIGGYQIVSAIVICINDESKKFNKNRNLWSFLKWVNNKISIITTINKIYISF